MSEIFVLNETKDLNYTSFSFNSLKDVRVIELRDPLELESHLKLNSVQILFLIVDLTPSDLFLNIVSKNRNTTSFRDAYFISLHRRFDDVGIQKTLMAGAKTIFLEPIDYKKVVWTVQMILAGEINRVALSLPKTKVLWIRETPLGNLEAALNK